jgi:hypothetical protein
MKVNETEPNQGQSEPVQEAHVPEVCPTGDMQQHLTLLFEGMMMVGIAGCEDSYHALLEAAAFVAAAKHYPPYTPVLTEQLIQQSQLADLQMALRLQSQMGHD